MLNELLSFPRVLQGGQAIEPKLLLTGVANYSPGPAVSNAELEDILQAPVSSLMSYFGVESRHYVINPRDGSPHDPDLGTAEMSARAAHQALLQAGVEARVVDTLICATSSC